VSTLEDQIEACLPRLRRYARALAGERHRAEDLVQDTLERAWSRLHLWRAGTDLRAWLFTIMHNLFVNEVRGARSQGISVPIDETIDVPSHAQPEDGLQMRDLTAALARLSPEQREVLLLVGLEDMSYEDTARVLGIPIGTVMSRLSRGRERLRELMSGEAKPVLRRVK